MRCTSRTLRPSQWPTAVPDLKEAVGCGRRKRLPRPGDPVLSSCLLQRYVLYSSRLPRLAMPTVGVERQLLSGVYVPDAL